ncbi:MAG: T9SS type A sorting domain-containing protein [bacterium]
MSHRYSTVGILAVLAVTGTTELSGQTKTLDRQYDPIVFDAIEASTALIGLPIGELTAYKYVAAQNAFAAIAFQIDEVDAGGKFFVETDGLIDANDELVFMPGDAGDRASNSNWLNDTGAQQNQRIEIEVTDRLAPAKKGWVYLFRNVSNPPVNVPGYIKHANAPAANGADTVKGVSYTTSHLANGIPNFQTIRQSNGQFSPNLIDRLKLRVKGRASIVIAFNYEANEDNAVNFVALRYGGGKVRGLRELAFGLSINTPLGPFVVDTVSFVTQYFPYSSTLVAKDAKLSAGTADLAGVQLIRQSLDFNANVAGQSMRFYNSFNSAGFAIDGVSDSPVPTLVDSQVNWFLATGQPGGVVVLLTVPTIGDARSLYYRDNTAPGTADGTTDTGDGSSYGDFGVQITDDKIQGEFSLDLNLTMYYLDPTTALLGNPVAAGEQFKAWQDSTVRALATAQTYMPSSVESPGDGAPDVFTLHEAYPNPFSATRERARIVFNLGRELGEPQLTIYNLMGQEVAAITPANGLRAGSGRQELSWNGRDANGHLLPAGIYFYRLRAGTQVATKKLILVR